MVAGHTWRYLASLVGSAKNRKQRGVENGSERGELAVN